MINYDIIVTCAFGLEAIVAYELKQLGYKELITENGQITFTADELAIARCNLWLRSAERVLIKVGQFKATSFEELFENTKSLPWADFLPKDANFPVAGKSIKSKLFSISDCQAIAKKAIVEKMKERYKIAWFEETGDRYQLEVALLNDIATLTIDTSGIGLHKRGYRTLSSPAPLKETLAAALINISRWKPDRAFIDPLCGSGTIPIEAALIGHNIAPGLGRDFAGEKWDNFNKKLWQSARDEAYSLIDHSQPLGIWAYDIDKEAISLARYHAKQAGVNKLINFQVQDVSKLNSRYKYGYLICNPPYGERLLEEKEVETLYKTMAKSFSRLDTWSYYILTSHPSFTKVFGRKSDKRRKLYNGRIETTYHQFFGPKPQELKGPFAKIVEN